jgi:hypothetical protein
MLDTYSSFFVASSAASAAFIGLLFVALTIANLDSAAERTRARRDTLAGSAFVQLLDAFFVSTASLAGNLQIFAGMSVVMAGLGLLSHSRLIPRVIRSGNWSRGAPGRRANIALPVSSILVYLCQLGLAAGVLLDPNNALLLRLAVLIAIGLFAGALARSWEIASRLGSR